jgi:hypothetical protein
LKKNIFFIALFLMVFVSFGHIKEVHAAMPVACNAPSAPSYPEYYTECVGGSSGSGTTVASSTFYYVSYLDQYRMDYGTVSGSTKYTLHFVAANGTVYNADYNFAPTGTHYLTCNGKYNMLFYNASSVLIASTAEIITTAIVNPTCNSYADGATGKDDLSGSVTNGKITWQPKPDAVNYEIYKDGVKVGETTGTEYTPTSDGSYSVVAKDTTGAIVGQTDINVTSNPATTCDECTKLSQLLACPDWGTYMGELTNAVKAAIPPPPDWDMVAEKIGNSVITKFSDYVGQVPAIPTVNDINQTIEKPALPTVDNSSQKAQDLIPTVPSDFNQPLNNDLDSAPVIPIVDNSRPFSLMDPLSNLTYDNPNVPVFPQDPRNNSGGIDAPTTINEPAPTPKAPVSDPSSPPIENAPHVEIPTPAAQNNSGGAVPSDSTGVIPIPSIIP